MQKTDVNGWQLQLAVLQLTKQASTHKTHTYAPAVWAEQVKVSLLRAAKNMSFTLLHAQSSYCVVLGLPHRHKTCLCGTFNHLTSLVFKIEPLKAFFHHRDEARRGAEVISKHVLGSGLRQVCFVWVHGHLTGVFLSFFDQLNRRLCKTSWVTFSCVLTSSLKPKENPFTAKKTETTERNRKNVYATSYVHFTRYGSVHGRGVFLIYWIIGFK